MTPRDEHSRSENLSDRGRSGGGVLSPPSREEKGSRVEEGVLLNEGVLIDPEGRKTLAIGAAVGLLLVAVPLFDRLLSPLVTLFHELGHAVVFWAFGYPAIPSFDFLWGGGVTLGLPRSTLLFLGIHLLLGFYLYWWWQHFRSLVALGAGLVVIYMLLAWTPGHLTIIAFSGHLTTMVLAGVFLYRGLTGEETQGRTERTLYFASGLYVLFSEMAFAWGLASSEVLRKRYQHSPKAIMDLVVVARDFGISLVGAAWLYLLFTCLAPLALYLVLRRRQHAPSEVPEIPDEMVELPDVWDGGLPPPVRRRGSGERKP